MGPKGISPGILFQIAVGVATPVAAYVISTNRAPWVVLVVLLALALNAIANAVSLAREASANDRGTGENRYTIILRTVAGLSVLAAGLLVAPLA